MWTITGPPRAPRLYWAEESESGFMRITQGTISPYLWNYNPHKMKNNNKKTRLDITVFLVKSCTEDIFVGDINK